MNSLNISSGKTAGRALAALALTLTLSSPTRVRAQTSAARAGTTSPFAGGTNPDGSLKPSPPLTRLFAEEYYTEYSLLDPSTGEYRVTRRTEESPIGSSDFDWIRFEGELVPHFTAAEAADVEFYDPRSGEPLKFIFGKPGDPYSIRVRLPRPVPKGGVGRIYIYKTFKEPRTYIVHGDDIIWVRSLVGSRAGVVLPKGYGLVSSSVAAQIITQEDGRLRLSFANPSGQVDPVTIHARKINANFAPVKYHDTFLEDIRTLYDLDAPETHQIHVDQRYTDYRKGDKARLDTLSYLPLRELKVLDLDTAAEFTPTKTGTATLVKLDVPVVNDKQSAHLQLTGKLSDPGYRLEGGDLVFEGSLHGLRNTVLLPKGWDVVSVSEVGTVGMYKGRVFVALVNLHSDSAYRVTIRATKRVPAS
jgi:hypothetical protein